MKFYTDAQSWGNVILARGWDEDGKRVQQKIAYQPTLYVPCKEDSGFQNIYNEPVAPVKFDTIAEARDFVKKHRGMDGFPIYGMTQFQYTWINETFDEVNFDQDKMSIGIIDIEVGSDDGFPEPRQAKKPVTSIALGWRGKYLVFGCGDYKPHLPNVTYFKCNDETQLLSRFIQAWQKVDLDMVVGWNNQKFDMPYLINRIRRVLGDEYVKKLSPWGIVLERMIETRYGEEQVYDIFGIATIDYMDVYKKHAYIPQESWKLDHVASTDCGIAKVDYSEYVTLHRLFTENFQKFVEYNIRDVELIEALENRHKLLRMVISLTYDSKINFSDAMGSVRLWDVIIHNELAKDCFVVDPNRDGDKDSQYAGAFVKPPYVGKHAMVASFDAKSLYPSLVVEYNISPETLMDHIGRPFSIERALEQGVDPDITAFCRDNNRTFTANGFTWDKSRQGFFPRIVKRIMAQRDEYKREMLRYEALYEETKDKTYEVLANQFKVLQQVRKIQLNSLYGCMGNQYFRWFRLEAAEGITLSGQFAIQFAERWTNDYLNEKSKKGRDYVIAMDTDSIYVKLDDFCDMTAPVKDRLKAVHTLATEEIAPQLGQAFETFYNTMNGYERFLFMKLEVIANTGIWTAKKRYVLNVWFKEGVWYDEPKVKFTGLEAIKTSTPALCRDIIKKSVKYLLDDDIDGARAYIKSEEEGYSNYSFTQIAFPRGINGIVKYGDKETIFRKKTPFHVKGALFYNKAIRDHKLEKDYELIRDGDKIKFCEMLMPNPIFNKIVSVPQELPKELGLEQYINYKAMFEKSIIKPLTPIFNAAGLPIRVRPMLEFEEDDEVIVAEQETDEEDFFADEEEDEFSYDYERF